MKMITDTFSFNKTRLTITVGKETTEYKTRPAFLTALVSNQYIASIIGWKSYNEYFRELKRYEEKGVC